MYVCNINVPFSFCLSVCLHDCVYVCARACGHVCVCESVISCCPIIICVILQLQRSGALTLSPAPALNYAAVAVAAAAVSAAVAKVQRSDLQCPVVPCACQPKPTILSLYIDLI